MTKEVKTGLLVGLGFVIVIGILLTDHFRGTQEPAAAVLDRAGSTVRQTVNAPGADVTAPPIALAPDEVTPRGPVQTPRDIEPPASPIVLAPPSGQISGANPQGLSPNDPLYQAAKQNGEELVPVDGNGQPAPAIATNTYRAQPGDSVSRMAARLMGANTAKNRRAIIAANASLAADPNKVIVGQTYIIPGMTKAAPAAIPGTVPVPGEPGTASATNGGLQWVYTVKPGDTLWAIAVKQLGNASQIEAIKQLNSDVLHGGSALQPNMKLRLPAPPVAIAN